MTPVSEIKNTLESARVWDMMCLGGFLCWKFDLQRDNVREVNFFLRGWKSQVPKGVPSQELGASDAFAFVVMEIEPRTS